MKDQSTVEYESDSQHDKRIRALSLFIESLLKPDSELRSCAHNQKCFNELMEIRTNVLRYCQSLRWY